MSAAIDRGAPPAAGIRHPFVPPEPHRLRLANGFELLLAPRPGIPRAQISLLFPAGGERNPTDSPGLAGFAGALLDEGTAVRSGTELALALERLGATLSTGADWDTGHAELTLFSRDFDAGLRALAEVALAPSFPEAEVERIRRQTLDEILRRRDQPGVLADEALAGQLYPGTPYGALLLGTRGSLERVERSAILSFHRDNYRLGEAKLVVAGEFDPDRARGLAEELFGGAAAPPAVRRAPVVARESGPRVVVIDLPAAAQTELRLGQVGVPRTHPDRTRLGVLNALFGGKFTSRLNLNLRERHGYTYGVSSRFVDRRGPGPFVIGAAVENGVVGAAAHEILLELRRLREIPVEPDELRETRDYLLGVFPYTFQTVGGLVDRLIDLAVHALPDDFWRRSLDEIAVTTGEDLLALARRHLDPSRLVVVAAGPAATIAPQLADLGEVTIQQPA